jgi:hypothetical protein
MDMVNTIDTKIEEKHATFQAEMIKTIDDKVRASWSN